MGLNGRVGRTMAHIKVLIFEKESEEKGKRGHFEGGGKRTPSLLNLAPTKQCGSKIELLITIRNEQKRQRHDDLPFRVSALLFVSSLKPSLTQGINDHIYSRLILKRNCLCKIIH